MLKFINFSAFLHYLFDDLKQAALAAQIVQAMLQAQSPWISNTAEAMQGHPIANYNAIRLFLAQVNVKTQLLRMYQEEAEFVIGDPTEMPRQEAPKTSYVGTLSDG